MTPRTSTHLWRLTLALVVFWTVAAVAWFSYALTLELKAYRHLQEHAMSDPAPAIGDIVKKPGSDLLWRVDWFKENLSLARHELTVLAVLSPVAGPNWGPTRCPVEDLTVVRRNGPA